MAKKQKKSANTGKAWHGRFRAPTHRLVEEFTESLSFDQRLYAHDIQGSIAHCRTLERAGILTQDEAKAIVTGLTKVKREFDTGRFPFADSDEDIHMAVERRLTELVGPLGGKLHTGRSRNDQVSLDLRLYLRDALKDLDGRLTEFQRVLVKQARANLDVAMPGYTHLQRAQPVLASHHFLAYVEMCSRDRHRLRDALSRIDALPLGSGALAGSNYPVDRDYTAQLLGFTSVTQNSLDAVSDRDFVVETLAALSLVMVHLSRLSEEVVLWSSHEFRFVELPDAFCTGSSMMPQKKNPDVPELVRGKTGRVIGHVVAILATLKGLPLSYNRDLQEDKEALFDALDTTRASLDVMTELVKQLSLNRKVLQQVVSEEGMLATEVADYLVRKGVPFREAHTITGRLVRFCLDHGRQMGSLSLAELTKFSSRFGPDVFDCLTVESALDRKAQTGGTARKRVEARLLELERILG